LLAFNDLKTNVKKAGEDAKTCIDSLVKEGSQLVESQKQKGNTVTMKHQKAMTQSYQSILADINGLAFKAGEVSAALEGALGKYGGMGGSVSAADREKIMKEVETSADAAAEALPQIYAMYEKCHPMVEDTKGALSFYQTISETASAQSCDGKVIGPAFMVNGGADAAASCAKKCTDTVAPTQCVGFQLYTGLVSGVGESVCMLFSEISGVALYSKKGCPTTAPKEGKCYVPKVDIDAHELAVKGNTNALDYCFHE